MVLIGEEYVLRELQFIAATCKVIEYYSQSYECPSCKEELGDTENRDRKVSGSCDHPVWLFPDQERQPRKGVSERLQRISGN